MAKSTAAGPTGRTPNMEDPLKILRTTAAGIHDNALKSDNVDSGQQQVRALDTLLKELSEVQTYIGSLRKAAASHVGNLRVRNPKGKPPEGDIRNINGRSYTFIAGKFYPVMDTPPSGDE